MIKMIGKTKIEVVKRGCVDCGTEYAPGWAFDQRVECTIGGSRGYIDVSICSTCKAKREGGKRD